MKVADNRVVTLRYELRDTEGESLLPGEDGVVAYLHGGYGSIFPKLEAALGGKQAGEQCTMALDPEDAFGDYDPDLLRMEPRERFPEPLEVGMQFEGVPGGGEDVVQAIYTVTDIADGQVVLDGNHPLAGERVWVRAEVTDVRDATPEELEHGHVHGDHGIDHGPDGDHDPDEPHMSRGTTH